MLTASWWGFVGGGRVSAAMVAAVFLSNVPEATEHAGRLVGLMLMAGFTTAFVLSHL